MTDPTRESRLTAASGKTFDLLVIGGGIVGMAAARDAAFRGYSVLLLEAVDYAFGTSSRSSKFLHGGLRYLEQGDVGLVREALLEREIFVRAAPHICRPQRALVPISPGRTRPSWQVRIGLMLYDALAAKIGGGNNDLFLPHEKISPRAPEAKHLQELGLKFSDLYAYWDGQMEDTRLVIENMLDASELGGVILNHAPVTALEKEGSVWKVSWKDEVGGEAHLSQARYIINAGGPWAREISDKAAAPMAHNLRYSRGTHLLFDVDLDLPGLTLSAGGRGRVYFVWPYFSPAGKGTLVGTTERETENNEADPTPAPDEIEELLTHLRRDLPDSGLTSQAPYRAYAGMRVLVPRVAGAQGATSEVSRRERFEEFGTMLSVLGGKYTTSRLTAERAVDFVDRYYGKKTSRKERTELKSRPLPGGRDWSPSVIRAIRTALQPAVLAHAPGSKESDINRVIEAALFRLGTRAKLLLSMPEALVPCSNFSYLAGEAEIARSKEHAVTQDDIILRRLLLPSFPLSLEKARGELK